MGHTYPLPGSMAPQGALCPKLTRLPTSSAPLRALQIQTYRIEKSGSSLSGVQVYFCPVSRVAGLAAPRHTPKKNQDQMTLRSFAKSGVPTPVAGSQPLVAVKPCLWPPLFTPLVTSLKASAFL